MGEWDVGLRAGAEISYQSDSVRLDFPEYVRIVSATLEQLLPGDINAWNAADLVTGEVAVLASPQQVWDLEEMAQQLANVMDDHPMAASYLSDLTDTGPRRVSDVTTRSTFLRSRAYNELYRVMGADQQLTVLTRSNRTGRLHCWAVNRLGIDFTDAELVIAAALQPTLSALERTVLGVHDGGAPGLQLAPAAASGEPYAGVAERLGLTPREQQVLAALADGLTADAIGRLLRISPRTARKHLEHVYAKLGIHDRLLAARRAADLGLTPPRPNTPGSN